MNLLEAKQVLLLYRPGAVDGEDPEMSRALALVRQDQDLGRWFEEHCAFQRAMRAKLRALEAPAELKQAILAQRVAQRKLVHLPIAWQSPAWLAAAAVIVVFIGLALFWPGQRPNDHFENFQARMIGTALRSYRMDIVTNDMREVRSFLASRGAPANYELAKGLERLKLTGGGVLRWRNNPVSMVCFDRGDNQMLFLFVLNRAALKDPPPETPRRTRVSDQAAVSWTRGNQTYVLAGPEEADFDSKYLR